MTARTPLHDDLEAEVARLPNDAAVTLTARAVRDLVAEAHGIEEQVVAEWMDAFDPCVVI